MGSEVQRTEEWFAARLGKITASRWSDILPGARGYGASRKNYIADLVCERLTGKPTEFFESSAMKQGTEREPKARFAYEMETGFIVEEVGLVDHPTIPMCGASPDGLVGGDGEIEIKCPEKAQHLQTVLTGFIKPDYIVQMQSQMACTGRAWCDFVSYNPDFPDALQIKIIRIMRNPIEIAHLEEEATKALNEVDAMVAALKEIMKGE